MQSEASAWLGLAPASAKGCTGRAKEVCKAYTLDKTDLLGGARVDCPPLERACTQYTAWTERWRGLVG